VTSGLRFFIAFEAVGQGFLQALFDRLFEFGRSRPRCCSLLSTFWLAKREPRCISAAVASPLSPVQHSEFPFTGAQTAYPLLQLRLDSIGLAFSHDRTVHRLMTHPLLQLRLDSIGLAFSHDRTVHRLMTPVRIYTSRTSRPAADPRAIWSEWKYDRIGEVDDDSGGHASLAMTLDAFEVRPPSRDDSSSGPPGSALRLIPTGQTPASAIRVPIYLKLHRSNWSVRASRKARIWGSPDDLGQNASVRWKGSNGGVRR